ncbi:hypothetical protein N431DRAFT_534169 [Stipitochalara longipes BDJ]|nr:hypothetical protein N431DRAFT_534169 [Stipitochalara longipes BDJ]
MALILGFLLLLLKLQLSHAAPALNSECNSPLQALLLPLSQYAPVESFCSKNYPIPASTVTITGFAQKAQPTATNEKLGLKAGITTTADPRAAIWASLTVEAGSFLSTVCACIEAQQTVTVTAIPTTTSKASTTTFTSISTTPTALISSKTSISLQNSSIATPAPTSFQTLKSSVQNTSTISTTFTGSKISTSQIFSAAYSNSTISSTVSKSNSALSTHR